MKNIPKIIVFLLILSIFSSCKKNVVIINTDYVGHWVAKHPSPRIASGYNFYTNYNFIIKSNGRGSYHKDALIFDSKKDGVVKIRKDELRIGLKTFAVQQHPTYHTDKDGNYYTMELDSISYIRFE